MENGRPPIIATPEEFEEKAEAYFAEVRDRKEFPTVTGLAFALGFADRRSFYDYEKREGFSHIVKRARLLVENGYERQLQTGAKATGAIFALKNMGWSDSRQIEHQGIPSIVVRREL